MSATGFVASIINTNQRVNCGPGAQVYCGPVDLVRRFGLQITRTPVRKSAGLHFTSARRILLSVATLSWKSFKRWGWRVPISQHCSITCHMWSDSVTCHPTHECAVAPHLNSSQACRCSIYLPQRYGRLSWPSWLVIYQDGLPVHRQSPIHVVTTW